MVGKDKFMAVIVAKWMGLDDPNCINNALKIIELDGWSAKAVMMLSSYGIPVVKNRMHSVSDVRKWVYEQYIFISNSPYFQIWKAYRDFNRTFMQEVGADKVLRLVNKITNGNFRV
jgi:hypothetical protein